KLDFSGSCWSTSASSLLCPSGRAFFQATPLPFGGERESHKEASEENACPAGDKNHYRFSVDVAGFTPEEMTVNLEGRKVTVTAKRQRESQSKDSGYWVEHQELRRETLLPPDVDLQAIACSLNPDGQLCIEAPPGSAARFRKKGSAALTLFFPCLQ
uniref:SHSP domain-containing protein n=1 Tax=Naja naja TaxID=35670 RepID=A0A8C6VB52_NAJNA